APARANVDGGRRDIPELRKQPLQFVAAAMHVANEVEWAMLGSLIVPQGDASENRRVDLLRRVKDEHVPKALALQAVHSAAKLGELLADDGGAKLPIAATLIAIAAGLLGQVEHDGDREDVILPREPHERLPRLALHVGGVDNSE